MVAALAWHGIAVLVDDRTMERSQRVLADSGFFTIKNVRQREAAEIDASVPDADSAPELNGRVRPMPAEAGLPQAGVYPSLSLPSVPR